ncbi:MAG TPA: hypothetical protein VGO00_08570, partial [Kofleriaceae bacterium]|nr:hypothetical protein [Kofleriaceae bacterium]
MKLAIAAVLVVACSNSSSPPPPGPEPDDWCQRIVAGPSSSDPDPIALANAHFTYRYFGMATRDTVDAPLSAAFAGSAIDLDAYAAHATDACALDASAATLGPASVALRGDVAWIVPGTGDIA